MHCLKSARPQFELSCRSISTGDRQTDTSCVSRNSLASLCCCCCLIRHFFVRTRHFVSAKCSKWFRLEVIYVWVGNPHVALLTLVTFITVTSEVLRGESPASHPTTCGEPPCWRHNCARHSPHTPRTREDHWPQKTPTSLVLSAKVRGHTWIASQFFCCANVSFPNKWPRL